METVFSFIPAGWKATSPDTIEQRLDNGDYAYVHKYPDLHGLNVTIPYKEAVIPLLDGLDPLMHQVQL